MSEIENKNNPTAIEVNSIMLLQNGGNYEDAFKACKNLLIKYPTSPLLYNILGAINVGKSDFTNAIYSYLYAIKIKPNYAQAFNNLAILLKKLFTSCSTSSGIILAFKLYSSALANKKDWILKGSFSEKNITSKSL